MPVNQPIKIDVEDEEDAMPPVKNNAKNSKKTVKKSETKPKKAAAVKKPAKTVKKEGPVMVAENTEPSVKKTDASMKEEILRNIDNAGRNTDSVSSPAVRPKSKESKTAPIDIMSAGGAVKEAVAELKKLDEDKVTEPEEDILKKVSFRHSIKIYKKIAYSFIFLTVILLAVLAYFTFVKVTIVLIPNQERLSNNLIFDIYDKDKNASTPDTAIAGAVKSVEISDSKNYPATGSETIGENVTGKISIVNNYNKNQPLVATTRLLTTDGVLFRLKDTINVPAGGSIEAEIYADQPMKDMVIEPTKFTIPGLWAGLQEQIYGESKAVIKYEQQVKKHVTQEDIDGAAMDMKQDLITKAKADINEQYKDYAQILYKLDETTIKSEANAKVGDEKDEFTETMKAEVVVVAFNEDKPSQLAEEKFTASLPANKELINFDKENIIYSLNSFDLGAGTANVTGTFEGKISLKENSNIVDVNAIMGLNKSQLDAYLAGLPDIAGFEVKYYPSFIKQVPRLVDRIKIEIKK